MNDKNLSGEEKRQIMKEQFKKELRERQAFLEKVKRLRSVQRINKALSEMSTEDDTDEWISKLNEESAFTEAKMEIALESAGDIAKEINQDAELDRIVAEQMVDELKKEAVSEPQPERNLLDSLDPELLDEPVDTEIPIDSETSPELEEKPENLEKPSRNLFEGLD